MKINVLSIQEYLKRFLPDIASTYQIESTDMQTDERGNFEEYKTQEEVFL